MRGNIREEAPNLDLGAAHAAWLKSLASEELARLVVSYFWYLSPFLDRYLSDNGLSTGTRNAASLIEAITSDDVMPAVCRDYIADFDDLIFDSEFTDRIYDLTTQNLLFILKDACRWGLRDHQDRLLLMAEGEVNLLYLVTDDVVEGEVARFPAAYEVRRHIIEGGRKDDIIALGKADLAEVRSKWNFLLRLGRGSIDKVEVP
jgi:hypothetical protein